MIVLRVEDSKGFGPYHSFQKLHKLPLSYLYAEGPEHPMPVLDGVSAEFLAFRLLPHVRFGFRHLHQVFSWFSSADRRELHVNCKYLISRYEVLDECVSLGKSQLAFILDAVTAVLPPLCLECGNDSHLGSCSL